MSNKVLVIFGTMIEESKSYSVALTKRFVSHYQKFHPQDEIIFLNLNDEEMAQQTLNRHNFGSYFNQESSDRYINQLKSVNKVIISSPMTNFNVTSMVKNYLDHILVADKTFSYKYVKKGDAIGLLPHLKVQILTTQGAVYGWYLWGNHTEFLKGTWEFMGAKVTKPILIAGTKVKPMSLKTPNELIDQYDEEIEKAANLF